MFNFVGIKSWFCHSKKRQYTAAERRKLKEWGKREYLRSKEKALRLIAEEPSCHRTAALRLAVFLCIVYRDNDTLKLLQEILDREEQ